MINMAIDITIKSVCYLHIIKKEACYATDGLPKRSGSSVGAIGGPTMGAQVILLTTDARPR